ncbi:MAG: cohesin domain-containing protein [Acidobacteriota bacterium]
MKSLDSVRDRAWVFPVLGLMLLVGVGSAQAQTLGVPDLEIGPGETIDLPVVLSDGAGVSAVLFSLAVSDPSAVSIVGIQAGSLQQPPSSFSITSNPESPSAASPAGSIRVLVDSPGTSLASGEGSVVVIRLAASAGCVGSVGLTLSDAQVTRDLVTVAPALSAGSASCRAAADPPTLAVPESVPTCPGETIDLPISLSEGAGISALQFTLAFSPVGAVEVIGLDAGDLLTQPSSFTITTNPAVIDASQPAMGPLSVLIDSSGTSFASGPGSALVLRLRRVGECSSVDVALLSASATLDLVSVAPPTRDGSLSCRAGIDPSCGGGGGSPELEVAVGSLMGRPGTEMAVPILLTNGDATCRSSSLSTDLSYDPAVLSPLSPCLVELGAAAEGWSADCTELEPGLVRVLVFGRSEAMFDGEVARLVLQVAPDATPGARTELGNSCAIAQAEPLLDCPVTCRSGELSVFGVPGDIDGDGAVAITELLAAVTCHLGLSTSGCDASDQDDSGAVGLLELQCVINNFLGIPCLDLREVQP